MKYKKGYKIQVVEDFSVQTEIYPPEDIFDKYITLLKDGWLTIRDGYASDLNSGPTISTKAVKRGSVAHDSLYELMRKKLLSQKWRVPSDEELVKICLEDGAWAYRMKWWFRGLQVADGAAALPENKKKIFEAP